MCETFCLKLKYLRTITPLFLSYLILNDCFFFNWGKAFMQKCLKRDIIGKVALYFKRLWCRFLLVFWGALGICRCLFVCYFFSYSVAALCCVVVYFFKHKIHCLLLLYMQVSLFQRCHLLHLKLTFFLIAQILTII